MLVEWPDCSQSFAQVKWIDQNRLGLQLETLTGDFADRIDPASLGADWICKMVKLQAEFQASGRYTT